MIFTKIHREARLFVEFYRSDCHASSNRLVGSCVIQLIVATPLSVDQLHE